MVRTYSAYLSQDEHSLQVRARNKKGLRDILRPVKGSFTLGNQIIALISTK